jgi:hypothetical protein
VASVALYQLVLWLATTVLVAAAVAPELSDSGTRHLTETCMAGAIPVVAKYIFFCKSWNIFRLTQTELNLVKIQ